MFNIPFRSVACKRALEKSKTYGVGGNGIGGTPHMEGSDMVGGIFTSKAFELGNAEGSLVGIAGQLTLWQIGSLIS